MAAITPWYCGCGPGRHSPGGQSSPNPLSPGTNAYRQMASTAPISRSRRAITAAGVPLGAPCLYRKSDSAIMVMKAAEDGRKYDAAHVLDGAMDRSVLVERPMRPQLVIIDKGANP